MIVIQERGNVENTKHNFLQDYCVSRSIHGSDAPAARRSKTCAVSVRDTHARDV